MQLPARAWNFEGFLFDAYSVGNEVWLWIIGENRRLFLATDTYFPVIYIHGSREVFARVTARLAQIGALAAQPRLESKVLFYENRSVEVLRIEITDPGILPRLKRRLFTLYGRFDIYHSDVDPVAGYLTSRGLYPLAPVRLSTQIKNRRNRVTAIEATESAWSFEYSLPELRILQVSLRYSHRLGVRESNPLELKIQDRHYTIAEKTPAGWVREINRVLRREDPDCIISAYGDQVIFPFLFRAAQQSGEPLELDRDLTTQVTRSIKTKGSSFNTYGSWIFRAASYPLYGRWHIDQQNSFTFKHTDLAGTLELSRISGMMVQRLARASTGNALTEMETEVAMRKNYLVPWQKSALENRKTWYELQLYDKGGLIFQPDTSKGIVRHNVAQLDFSQMYPTIMNIHNVSPETINCPCCADLNDVPRVPETGYHICVQRRGVVSDSLQHILERRRYYKQKLTENLSAADRLRYEQRVDSLKWMNVVSFGYLGFRNAKFGKLESHESVTAFGRDKLLTAIALAERHGFELVHAITDCIFITRRDDEEIPAEALRRLCDEIYTATSVEMSNEGIYSWALFLPSRTDERMPVANRYLGRFKTGKLKLRGIAVRRKDTPQYIADFQRALLQLMVDCKSSSEVAAAFTGAQRMYELSRDKLLSGTVPWQALLLRRTVSHELDDYQVFNGTSLTMRELADQGITVSPGEKVRYLATELRAKDPLRRFVSEERAAASGKEVLPYDRRYYGRLLYEAFYEIFAPFVPAMPRPQNHDQLSLF
ncbi:MAG: DNA polymerase domain-containing protein [Spirochaetota bacterium]